MKRLIVIVVLIVVLILGVVVQPVSAQTRSCVDIVVQFEFERGYEITFADADSLCDRIRAESSSINKEIDRDDSTGATVGIAVGVIAAVIIIGGGAALLMRRRTYY